MPRQNRVTPSGAIIATPERGTYMGNRGVLHDEAGCIKRAWQVKRWIVCVLEFRGRKRKVMSPGHYTELFFLDEATAFAAGHRPCAECQHERFKAYRDAWSSRRPSADAMDARLHAERLAADRSKRLFRARLKEMPSAVFVQVPDWGADVYLVWKDALLLWTAAGYNQRKERPKDAEVLVLTPASTVRVLRAGYAPQIHPSAARLAPSALGTSTAQ
jgi:hypothetical protein